MEAPVDQVLRRLHEFVAGDEFAAELREAKADFWRRVIAPLPGEPIEELRLASFVEWFIFDRQLTAVARTPVEEYLRRRSAGLAADELMAAQGFSRTVHSVFVVRKRKDLPDLQDLYTGDKYPAVQRVPLTLGKGDIAELRLVPVGEQWFATDALCFHPYLARKPILKMLKEARKKGEPIEALVFELLAMNTRFERYPKTAKRKAYERGAVASVPRP